MQFSNERTHNVMTMSTPPRAKRKQGFGMRPSRVSAIMCLMLLAGPLLSLTSQTLPAAAAAAASASLDVKWTADTSAASTFQPARSMTSPHYPEFRNIAINVSQTTGLIDQAVRVSVTGFAGTVSSPDFGNNAKNYIQAMQCWGDPAAADFRQTCQWGGRSGSGNNGLGSSVYPDNALRVAQIDNNPYNPTTFDVPFTTFDGTVYTGKNQFVTIDGKKAVKNALLDVLDATTTNEITSARVAADGTGTFDFETQSADQAPQLGCGREGHLRCWLVVVPRGTVFGGDGAQCSSLLDPDADYVPYANGRPNSYQGGSPINPKCDYWDNRIVVPLDFVKTGTGCVVGGSEVKVIGSQLMVGAMSSWQPDLCRSLNTTYSFSTNSDAVARAQILDGLAPVGFSGLPLSPGGLDNDPDRQTLAKTKLVYAPAAISGVVIAFNAEFGNGRQESLVLSPRLMAKLLTQSYPFTVPTNSSDPAKNIAHLPAQNQKTTFLYLDPEFKALNPTNYLQFIRTPSLVLPGPSGADALRQVWRWIQADTDAVAFLDGKPAPGGMTVNPYYLPLGNPAAKVPTFDDNGEFIVDASGNNVLRDVGLTNIDGTPQSLSTAPLDVIPKDDESKVPLKLSGERSRFDSLQFAPYTDSLLSAARQAFRANTNSKTTWDPSKINSAGEVGDYVGSGAQSPGQKFIITITDSPSAIRYGLSTATLQLPNSTERVDPSTDRFAASMTALEPTALDTVKQVDPSKVTGDGYPLTMVTYAMVNLTKSTPSSRLSVASLLSQVTTSGQVSGSALGQLPAGYLPLTRSLLGQAEQTISTIKSYIPAVTTQSATALQSSNGIAQDDYEASRPAGTAGTVTAVQAAGIQSVTPGVDKANDARTAASSVSPIPSNALAMALVFGLLGLLIAPLLFRGRRAL